MFTSKLYTSSPIFIQNSLLSVRALLRKILRENTQSSKLCETLYKNEKSTKTLNQFVNKQLDMVLTHATTKVEAYNKFNPQLSEFPYISKLDIKQAPDKFLDTHDTSTVIKGSTSGTTGTPLSIPQNMMSVVREQAFISRSLAWAGFEKGDKRAWLRGDMIVPLSQKEGPFWRYSYFEDMLMLSSYHMTQAAIPLYLNAMQEYGVDVIQAYPSSIVTLAKYLEQHNEYYQGNIKSILTSSESFSATDKALVESRFKCKVFDWYGLFERVAAIASCEEGNYHILTDYAHVELLPAGKTEDGRSRAEIVGTNFNNSRYPLIRYKTGDHVIISDKNTCPCGRVYPIVEEIEGRVGDYLIAEGGQKVHILNHIPKGVQGLLATQFIQDVKQEITILAVVDETFTDKQQQKLVNNAKEKLGQSVHINVNLVDAIPRTKNGKVRQAICNLAE